MKTTMDLSFITLANTIRDGVLVYLEKGFVYANASMVSILEYDDVQDLCGKELEALLEPDLVALLQAEVGDTAFEVTLKTKLGNPLFVEITQSHTQWQGKAAKLLIVRDLSSKQILEHRIKVKSQIIDQIHDAVVSTDLNGYVMSWNVSAENLFGYSRAQALGKHISFLCPIEQHRFLQEEIISPLLATGNNDVEVTLLKKSGETFFAHLVLSLLRDQNNEVIGMIGYTSDLSKTKVAEGKLVEVHKLKELLFTEASTGIVIYDGSGQCVEANSAMASIVGGTYEQVLRHNFCQIDASNSSLLGLALKTIEKKQKHQTEVKLSTYFGKSVIADVRFIPFDNAGTPYLLLMVDDITDRKNAEEALRKSETLLTKAQSISHIGHWTLDPLLNTITGSDEFYRIFGLTRNDDTFDAIVAKIHPDDRQKCMAAHELGITQAKPWSIVYRLLSRDGTHKTVRGIGEPILDDSGKTVKLVGAVQDITDLARAEESHIRLKKILEATPDFIAMGDVSGHIVYMNKGGRRMVGLDENADLSDKKIADFHPRETAQLIESEGLPTAMRDGMWRGETDFLTADGRLIPTSQIVICHKTASGEVEYISTIARDISATRRVEVILRALASGAIELEFNQFLTEIVGYLAKVYQTKYAFVGLLVGPENTHIETKIVWANSTITDNFSYELVGSPCEDVITGKKTFVPNNIRQQYPDDELLTKMGVESYFGAPLKSPNGDVIGLIAVMDDRPMAWVNWMTSVLGIFCNRIAIQIERDRINNELLQQRASLEENVEARTRELNNSLVELNVENQERLKAEKLLRKAKNEAERTNRFKSELIGRMSHELRTPMNAILGFGQLLKMQPQEDDSAQMIDEIMMAGYQLQDLIDEVLDLSSIESGGLLIKKEKISVAHIVKDVILLFTSQALAKGIKIIDEVTNHADAFICADEVRLKQVLINLVTNAINYNNNPAPYVKFSLDCQSDVFVRIQVSDNGKGIEESSIDRVFEPFNRLGEEYGEVEGAGIGLAISQRLMELMYGGIGLTSVVGEGSVFWIDCPIAYKLVHKGLHSNDVNNASINVKTNNVAKILYVEDNPANMRLVQKILEGYTNVELLVNTTAEDALEVAKAIKPDLIILDINLPGINGYEALLRFHEMEETRGTPVIALSAAALPADIARGLSSGFNCYLTKPLDVSKFINAIESELSITIH